MMFAAPRGDGGGAHNRRCCGERWLLASTRLPRIRCEWPRIRMRPVRTTIRGSERMCCIHNYYHNAFNISKSAYGSLTCPKRRFGGLQRRLPGPSTGTLRVARAQGEERRGRVYYPHIFTQRLPTLTPGGCRGEHREATGRRFYAHEGCGADCHVDGVYLPGGAGY